jgi:hypothetical protein
VELVSVDELESPPPANRCLLFKYKAKADYVQHVSFVDGKMIPLAARESMISTKSGDQVQMYYFDANPLNDETQAIFEVHPTIEDIQLPFEAHDLALP